MSGKFIKAICITIILLMTIALAGCGDSSNNAAISTAAGTQKAENSQKDEEVKLKIYCPYVDDDTKQTFDYAKEKLSKELPNVVLELEVEAQDDNQKLKTYAASGNLPDIYRVDGSTISLFKKSNNVVVLDDYIDKFGLKDKMDPNSKSIFYTSDGHCYAFPWVGNDLALLYYNKEIFEKFSVKVPATYDEFMTAVKTFVSNNIIPLSIFAKEKWPCVSVFDLFVTRLDPQGITKLDTGKAKASDPAFKDAAQKIADLVKAGLVQKGATNMNFDQAAALFYEGKAAMFMNGEWEIPDSTKKLGNKVDYMYPPAVDAESVESVKLAFSGGGSPGGFAVSPNTKDRDLTAKAASIMAYYIAESRYLVRGNPFIPYKISGTPQKQLDPMMARLAKELPNIKSTSAFSWCLENPKALVAIEDNCQKLFVPGYTADKFVRDLDKALDEAHK